MAQRHDRSLASPYVELRRVVARVADISRLVDQLKRFVSLFTAKLHDVDGGDAVGRALRAALANAVIHCNREKHEKKVVVICRCTMDGELSITVGDEGEGL